MIVSFSILMTSAFESRHIPMVRFETTDKHWRLYEFEKHPRTGMFDVREYIGHSDSYRQIGEFSPQVVKEFFFEYLLHTKGGAFLEIAKDIIS